MYQKAFLKSPVEKLDPTPDLFFPLESPRLSVETIASSKSFWVLEHSGFRFRIRSENLRYRNPHRLGKLAKSRVAEPCRNPLFRPYLVQRIGPNSRSSVETIANRMSFWVRYFRSLTLNIQDSDSGFEVKTFGIAIHIALKKACQKQICREL